MVTLIKNSKIQALLITNFTTTTTVITIIIIYVEKKNRNCVIESERLFSFS